MEHKFLLGSFHRENGTTFSGIPLFPEIFQWNEPKNHVPFTTQPEFPEFFSKWKTPYMSGFFKMGSSLRQNFFACLPATAGREAFAVLEKAGGGGAPSRRVGAESPEAWLPAATIRGPQAYEQL